MSDVPLIAWEDVPEGPVWWRMESRLLKGAVAPWRPGIKDGGLFSGGSRWTPPEVGLHEFAAAEQQPGDYARVVQERDDWKQSAEEHSQALGEMDAELTRLRDGLAILIAQADAEIATLTRYHVERPDAAPALKAARMALMDARSALAALREGRE